MSRVSKKVLSYRALIRVQPTYQCMESRHDLQHQKHRQQKLLYESNAVAADAGNCNQADLDAASAKNSVRLTPASMLYSGRARDPLQRLRFAHYLQRELPVRFALQLADFQALPPAATSNPKVQHVQAIYKGAFHKLTSFPTLKTEEDEARYSNLLRQMLQDDKDVSKVLSIGLREARLQMPNETFSKGDVHYADLVRSFMDKTLSTRLGIRMLCEHHVTMHQCRQDFVGVVGTNFCPGDMVKREAAALAKICELTYGTAPSVKVDGSGRDASFTYIPQPVDFIIKELLKNAYRATVQYNKGRSGSLPKVRVTVAKDDVNFVISISDRGGGVPHDIVLRIFDYNFSTADDGEDRDTFQDRMSKPRGIGIMHGFGLGLPVSRAYARYLGGTLTFETMPGVGSVFHLRLKHINDIKI